MIRRFFARLASLLRGRRAELDMLREIESHLALLQDDFERRGIPPREARLAARRVYGGVEQAKELHREARSFRWVGHAIQDIRYGARNLLRTPGFTAVAILTLALGIGANTAVFGVVNAVLFRPLAYRNPGRLVTVLHRDANPVAPANYIDWEKQTRSFETMGAAEAWGPNLTRSFPPEHLLGLHVTQNLLPTLGVRPLLGRLFISGEDQKGAEHEVILSYTLWDRYFGRDPEVLGKQITLDGEGYTVVGVMPRGFQFAPFWATRVELWSPMVFGDRIHDRGGNSLRIFARLKGDITLVQARADVSRVTTRLERQYPGTNRGVTVTPLKENVVGKVETPLLMLLGAVGFVLLIACANVAHMLLARTSDRRKETAVRTALGAGRARVISQLLTENSLLGLLGAAAGLLIAFSGTKALATLGAQYVPRMETVTIDGNVALFLLGVTMLTTLLSGLVPAMHAVTANLSDALKEGGRGDSDGIRHNRLRSFLVASEFALAFMLLIGAGLMIRSFHALQSIDPGFNPENVVSLVVSVEGTREAEPNRRAIFYRELLARIRTLPGVDAVGAINHLPLAGDMWGRSFAIEGRPRPLPGEAPGAVYRIVMPGYFETMRLPLRSGRAITGNDGATGQRVVVVNERAAREYWRGEDPIGKRIAIDEENGQPLWLTIIGVVKNAKQLDWAAEPYPEVYLSALQSRDFLGGGGSHTASITVVARTAGDSGRLTSALKTVIWSFDRNLPISDVYTMTRVVADANARPRFEMFLLGIFSGVAFVLAAVGIYGVMNYSVSRRTREIGIRVSLGANRSDVLGMLLRQGMSQASAGTAAGIAGAILLSKLMSRMLYGVQPTDPVTFGSVAVLLSLAALLAICVPASRATRIAPMTALRND